MLGPRGVRSKTYQHKKIEVEVWIIALNREDGACKNRKSSPYPGLFNCNSRYIKTGNKKGR